MSKEGRLLTFFETLQADLISCPTTDGAKRFAVERQSQRARKRARLSTSGLQEQAVASFLECNRLVGDHQVTLDPQVEADARHFITVMLERFTSSLSEESVQTTLDLGFVFDNWRFGPGASNGVEGTHTAEKISQPMTCTGQVVPLVRKLRSISPYFVRFDSGHESGGVSLVRGSKLATVPKNEDTMRTIAIEPSGNMALQLAAGRYLEGTLRYIGLDIRTQQPKNKAAALRGSVDGSLATLDLKSASDMIGLDLVRRLMPREWIWLLETLRSREIRLPCGEWVTMNMVSTMGNGFTFPLMTLIIVALIYGYRAQHGGPSLFLDWTNTCVFGDDIIVPVHEYESISAVLAQAGFVVNTDKSYGAGPFRESCGGDYYEGVDVTPFYVKTLDTPSDIYVAINQVLEWSEKTNTFLGQTLTLLSSYLDGKALLVPEWSGPNSGILTSQCSRRYKYLMPVKSRRLLKSADFEMMLAVGGYIDESGSQKFFSPRVERPKMKLRDSRLPRGYLDGWDAGKRTRRSSDAIALIVAIVFA